MTDIQNWLFAHQDQTYRTLNIKLIPNILSDSVIGVRTPALREYAKQLVKEKQNAEILETLPHQYFEENQLHAFLLSEMKDYGQLLEELERFLPYIDNWATCDQLRPKIFKKYTEELFPHILAWIHSEHDYTIRFGIGMLLAYYLDGAFEPQHLQYVAKVHSKEYYVNMMSAWYFATALAKQYDATLPLIESKSLDRWVHNKSIQKARESRRVSQERKDYLNTLKIK